MTKRPKKKEDYIYKKREDGSLPETLGSCSTLPLRDTREETEGCLSFNVSPVLLVTPH